MSTECNNPDTFAIRLANAADAATLASLFQLVYRNSSHPLQNLDDVARFLRNVLNLCVVADVDGRIVASMAMTHCPWNDSYECGRALTDPEWRRQGVAPLLMHRVLGEIRERGMGQVYYGYPRVRRIAELAETVIPAFVVTGHDGGRNVANGARETHLIMCAVPSHARFEHVAPDPFGRTAFVQEEIYRPLGLAGRVGSYPPFCFVGDPAAAMLSVGDFLVGYNPTSAHRGIEILGHQLTGTPAADLCGELDDVFRRIPDARHVTITLLADKVDLVRALCLYGFDITAYLPAWYQAAGRRYDCVQLARRAYAERPRNGGFDDILERIRDGLRSLESAIEARASSGAAMSTPHGKFTRLAAPPFRTSNSPAFPLAATEVEASTWRPLLFRLSSPVDRAALFDCLARKGKQVRVHDTIAGQLRDLVKTRHPSRRLAPQEIDSLATAHLGGQSLEEYGVWVYYPWSDTLVHVLDEEEFAELRTNRNRNKITAAEQAALATKRIGVVGLSVGQSVALTLALERQFRELRLADFDAIELSNLNRIRAGVHCIGVPKVYVAAREIAEIDPFLNVTVFSDGITPDNIGLFLSLHGDTLDAIVEEGDSLDVKVLVRDAARRHRVPVVMETSERGMLDVERFDLEPNRPFFHGLVENLQVETLRGLTTEQKLPFVLQIVGLDTMSDRMVASMMEIEQTVSTWPQLGSDVVHGGAAAAHAVRRILLGQSADSGRFLFDLDRFGQDITADVSGSDVTFTATPSSERERVSDPIVRHLVSQAILAPSGGNSQPWIWHTRGSKLELLLDERRTGGLVDVEGGGSYAALGCAAENLILAAHASGLEVSMELFPNAQRPDHVATFVLSNGAHSTAVDHWADHLSAHIGDRHTNRTLGPRLPLIDADLTALTLAVMSVDGARVQWLTDETALARLGDIAGACDRLRILHPEMHREMFHELRWSREEVELRGDGIDVATLALSASDMLGLRLASRASAIELVRQWGGGRNLDKMSRKYIVASSAVGLITMPAARAADYFNGGRAIERMWLTATERGLAVHPITTAPYLFARLVRKSGQGLDEAVIAELHVLRREYIGLFDVADVSGEVLLFRVAQSPAAATRSTRRPLDDVLVRAHE